MRRPREGLGPTLMRHFQNQSRLLANSSRRQNSPPDHPRWKTSQRLTEITLEETLRSSVSVGSPDTVVGKLKDLQRDIGLSGVQLGNELRGPGRSRGGTRGDPATGAGGQVGVPLNGASSLHADDREWPEDEGHEDQFPLRRLSRPLCVQQGTFAGTRGNGRRADSGRSPDREVNGKVRPRKRPSRLRLRIVGSAESGRSHRDPEPKSPSRRTAQSCLGIASAAADLYLLTPLQQSPAQ